MEQLKKILAQEDSVLFIGSGISSWSGLPSWSGIIEELATFVEASGGKADLIRAEAARGDLLQAASYGFDKLTQQQVGDFIRSACRYGAATPQEIHRKIVSLGTRCYVTTNYDNLLEEALRKWQPDRFNPPPICNRQLTEMPRIANARALDFVFKPHGDAADSSSIILTREQYRKLLPQGELHHALETLKTLLVSRPVVYLGFGLRDPDFLYVRDLLANTYKGATRDHYAVMADVTEAECDYWRRHYGIHLVAYQTLARPDGTKDHAALLTLLDSLLEPAVAFARKGLDEASANTCTPELVLSLARYAARLARAPKVTPEFEVRVHSESADQRSSGHYLRPDKYDHYPIGKFLDEGPENTILVGLPGAGKTYALRQAAARLAERLHEACLGELFDASSVVVPVFVDLKLYRGDLVELVNQTLPHGVPFDQLTNRFRVRVLLDSFNEMPREYWESGTYETDLAKFVEIIGRSSLVVGSRTSDGLGKLGFPVYCLDEIKASVVTAELARMGVSVGGRFDREVRSLLQKPFYFQLFTSGAVSLPNEAHPRDFYQSFFENLGRAFLARFGYECRIEEVLSVAAYDAINRGEEAYPLSDLLVELKRTARGVDAAAVHAQEVANWLVSTSVLIPLTGGRIAFVHQSVTEYLAAKELARRYQETPRILKEKLALTRWDQALFLALSLLPPSRAEEFFDDVASADLALALNAVKYLEVGRDAIVSRLLDVVHERIQGVAPHETRIEWMLESSLPVSDVHEPQLRELMKLGDVIGGAAVTRLVALKGPMVKGELLRALVDARSDYNYCCNGIGRALRPFATAEDVRTVVELADAIAHEVTPDSEDDAVGGFTSGVAAFLAEVDIAAVRDGFLPPEPSTPVPEMRARILCTLLWHQHSTKALELAGDLLLRGVDEAATSISFIASHGRGAQALSWASFTGEHVERLVALANNPDDQSWALRALRCLCVGRTDLAEVVKSRASERTGIAGALLHWCAAPTQVAPVFEALRDVAAMSAERRILEPLERLQQIEIDWAGHEDLFVQLLKLREPRVALAVLDQVHLKVDGTLGRLEIGAINWWLEWLMDEGDADERLMLHDRLAWALVTCVSKEKRQEFVAEFNRAGSKYRPVLARSVLLRHKDLTTDDFSEDAVAFLLTELRRVDTSYWWRGDLLGYTATEHFVSEKLLPLLPKAKGVLRRNLRKILRQAGARHGRRYLFD